MYYELNALIINAKNELFKIYENDLIEFGYTISHCNAEVTEIIAQSIRTDCDIIILSQNDFEDENDVIKLIEIFRKNELDKIPLILNVPTKQSLKINKAINNSDFIFNILPTGEKGSIIHDIERYMNYKDMSYDKLFFLLKQKVLYICSFVGIKRSSEGYKWISEAILLIITNSMYKKNFSSGVYRILENKYSATYTQIEPAIRRCINDQYKRMEPHIKKYYFDLDETNDKKYTTTHFINKMADNVKIQFKRNYQYFMDITDNVKSEMINEHFLIKR